MTVRRNLVANLVGSAWTGAVMLLFIPVYLHAIGAEGYGLVGFFVTLASLMTIFDGGFGAAAARELARSSASGSSEFSSIRNLIRTLEWIFWGVALLLGALVAASAPLIAMHWLNLGSLPRQEALAALQLMGLALALQWPIAYYSGCLVGLQRQVGLNLINAVTLTVRYGGAALVVSFVEPTVTAFFSWQAAAAFVQLAALHYYLWRCMPGTGRAAFVPSELSGVGRFALGVAGINVLGLVLTQIDKVVLSNILPLKQFGYYTIASTLAAVVGRVVIPIFNATYPRLAALTTGHSEKDLIPFYRAACDLMAAAIVPLSLLLIVFSREIVTCWTGDRTLAEDLRWVVAILAAGTLCNGLMTIPYALQLAKGWTSLALWQNVVAVLVLVPAIGFLTKHYGLRGAASVWFAVNLGYVLISAPIMYRRLLPAELGRWYRQAVLSPVALATGGLLVITWIAPTNLDTISRPALFVHVALAGLFAQVIVSVLIWPKRCYKFLVANIRLARTTD